MTWRDVLLPAGHPCRWLICSLGWHKPPTSGGERYEQQVVEGLKGDSRFGLIVPKANHDSTLGLPSVPMWLPYGNRPIVLLGYYWLQLLVVAYCWNAEVLRIHSLIGQGPSAIIARVLLRLLGRRASIAVVVHHVEPDGSLNAPSGRLGKSVSQWVLRHSDIVITPSVSTATARPLSHVANKVCVVNNPVSANATVQREEATMEASPTPTVLFVGQLIRRKAVDQAVRAVGLLRLSHPTAKLVVVGRGPEEASMLSLASDLGVPLEHYREVPDLEPFFARASVLVCTSREEGFYYVGVEAALAGVRVAAWDLPVLSEVLGEAVVTAPRGDFARLADQMGACLERGRLGRSTVNALVDPYGSEAFRSRLANALGTA